MRDEQKVWNLMGETSASIFPLAQNIMAAQFEKHFSEQRFYQPTFTASNLAPKPISAVLLGKRNPYANPAHVEKLLQIQPKPAISTRKIKAAIWFQKKAPTLSARYTRLSTATSKNATNSLQKN